MKKPLGPPSNTGLYSRVMSVGKGRKGPAKVKPKGKGSYKTPGFQKAPNLKRNLTKIIADTSSDPDSSSEEDPWASLTAGLSKKEVSRLTKKVRSFAEYTFNDDAFGQEVKSFVHGALSKVDSTLQESNLLTKELTETVRDRVNRLPLSIVCRVNGRMRPVLNGSITSYRKCIQKHFMDLVATYDRYVADGHIVPETRRYDGELFVRRVLKEYLELRS